MRASLHPASPRESPAAAEFPATDRCLPRCTRYAGPRERQGRARAPSRHPPRSNRASAALVSARATRGMFPRRALRRDATDTRPEQHQLAAQPRSGSIDRPPLKIPAAQWARSSSLWARRAQRKLSRPLFRDTSRAPVILRVLLLALPPPSPAAAPPSASPRELAPARTSECPWSQRPPIEQPSQSRNRTLPRLT